MTMDELRDAQVAMEDKVYRIWTVLSAFEGNKTTKTVPIQPKKKVTCGFSFFFPLPLLHFYYKKFPQFVAN